MENLKLTQAKIKYFISHTKSKILLLGTHIAHKYCISSYLSHIVSPVSPFKIETENP